MLTRVLFLWMIVVLRGMRKPVRLGVRFAHRIWEETTKQRFKHCGKGVRTNGWSHFIGYEAIEIGDNVHIGNTAFIRGEGGLVIGDNTHISRNVVIYTFNHNYHGKVLPYDETVVKKPVKIGRNVWIGMNVCIVPGVTIGDGAIIGMGMVVAKDVPPLAIVVGTEQRVVGYRDRAHYERLERQKLYGGPNGKPF